MVSTAFLTVELMRLSCDFLLRVEKTLFGISVQKPKLGLHNMGQRKIQWIPQ